MKKSTALLVSLSLLFSCKEENLNAIDNQTLFQEMWSYVDENYIYFEQKGVDWDQMKVDYGPLANELLDESEFLDLCSEMINTLRDGHNFIDVPGTRRGYNFKDGFEIHFDLPTIKNRYLKGQFEEVGPYTYGILNDSIAYIYLEEFRRVSRIHEVMRFFENKNIARIILDIRNNPGGSGQDAVEIVSHFIDEPTTVGYLVEKTGKSHDHVSEPLSIRAFPTRPFFDLPIFLLINRASYSAATYLASELKDLSNVTLIGQITGGGGGGNQTQELSNGWLITVSSSKLLDINFDQSIENGIAPNIEITNDSLILTTGIDEILERAIQEL